MKKYTKYFLFALAFIFAGALQLGGEANALSTYKNIRPLKTGDTIYFDNSGTNWNEVKIYFLSKCGGNERFSWNDRPTMTRIGETDVYKYEITSELGIEGYKDDHVIFSNNSGKQTIDLGFIETGYAYLANSEENGKAKGYWYVYDKTELADLVRSAKEYEAYSDYLTTASYDELVAQIRNAEGVVNSEIRVEADPNGNGYFTRFDISMEDLRKAIDDLEIDTGKLDEILNSDEITNIDRDKYTDESLEDLDEAVENAKDVLDNPNSSLEDIKNAADDVLETIGNLKEKEKAPVDSDVPTETPANPSTFDGIAVAVSGLSIASLAGFALYNKVKQRR
ncbi:MAG: starch-binding protein [bacterium]|nr:starch-binding protein [bacterium]